MKCQKKFKAVVIIMMVMASTISVNAQKPPNKQEVSVFAPANLKIDGKADEWNNRFRAYNNATNIFYTISNDEANLYLTVQCTDRSIVNKIVSGGISFAISISGKKNDKSAKSITYPVFEKNNKPSLSIASKKEIEQGSTTETVLPEAMVSANNKSFTDKSKLILVTGIKGVDSLISIYNTDGIKLAALFDNKMAYTYELAIPLKLLEVSTDQPSKFAYHILLNGTSPLTNKMTGMDAGSPQSGQSEILVAKINAAFAQPSIAPTDFWGEYTLAKK